MDCFIMLTFCVSPEAETRIRQNTAKASLKSEAAIFEFESNVHPCKNASNCMIEMFV